MKKINVLYIVHAPDCIGGALLSLVDLIDSVNDAVNPLVLINTRGVAFDYFQKKGIKCIIPPIQYGYNICENKRSYLYSIKIIYYAIKHMVRDKCCAYLLKKQLQNYNIDLVHTNTGVVTVGKSIAKILKVKHVWHIREFQDIDFNLKPLTGWNNIINNYKNADFVIAISKAVLNHFKLGAKNQIFIWDAVRSKRDSCFFIQKEKYILFCAATLCDAKGIKSCISSFAISGLSDKGYILKVVGEYTDEYKKELDELIQEKRLYGKVIFLGFCENVKELFKYATAFIMSSKNEGLGRVTIESMLYGCPVIALKTAGSKEIINDSIAYMYTTVEECAGLLQNVANCFDVEKIKYAQKYAIENFSQEVYGEKILTIYNELTSL